MPTDRHLTPPDVRVVTIAMLVTACIVAPCVYTGLSLLGLAPMTVPIFVAWLAWLQLVHGSAAVALWRRRAGWRSGTGYRRRSTTC